MATITAQAKLYTGIRCWCVDKNISAALSASFSVGNKDIDFPTDVPVLDANGQDTIYPNIYNWRLRRAVADLRCPRPQPVLTDERYKTYGGGNMNITVADDGRVVRVSEPDDTLKEYAGTFFDVVPESDNTNATPPTFNVSILDEEGVGVITLTITNPGKNNAQGDTLTFTPADFYPGSPEGEFTCSVDEITAPNQLLKTGGWTAVSTVSLTFPTYIEIDIEKLGIPEGTDCVLNFEEGWLLEDRGRQLPSGAWEYPNAVQNSLSPEALNYVTFRTPYYGVGRFISAFSIPNTVLRIKQLAATFPQALGSVTFRIRYNRGNLASLFVEDFSMTPTANFKASASATLYNFVDNGFEQWNAERGGLINFRLRFFECNAGTITFTQPDTNVNRLRFGISNMTSSFSMNATPVKETDINLLAFNNGAMVTNAVKTTDIISNNNNIVSSQSAAAVRTRDALSNITSQSSVSWNGNYIASSSRATILSTTSLEQSFDFVLEVDTSKVVPLATFNYIVDKSVLLYLYGFNGTVFWGDGTSNTYNSTVEDNGNAFHTYAVDGIYTIRVRGTLDHFGMVYKDRDPDTTAYTDRPRYDRYLGYTQSQSTNMFGGYRFAFTKVKAWGDTGLNNLERAFWGMENLTSIPGDLIEPLTNLKETFSSCKSLVFPSQMSSWNVSANTSLESTFNGCSLFNVDINSWNVSNVNTMAGTFAGCSVFNQPLNSWNTSNVTTLYSTFLGATVFNQSIDSWNVSNVESLVGTFLNARAFNQPLNSWNTSKVIQFTNNDITQAGGTFEGAWAFNQPLSNWIVNAPGSPLPAASIKMARMFKDARAFNQNINTWNVSRSNSFAYMFNGALAFNQPLSNWDMTYAISISNMFQNATAFNQDIGMWRTLSIYGTGSTSLTNVFNGATSFNQDLSKWCVSSQAALPSDFYTNTPSWDKTNRVPVWGTCPSYP